MTESTRNTPPVAGAGRRTALALFSAALFVGLAFYASRSPLPTGPAVAAADDSKDKTPAASTPQAVAGATAFIDSLNAKQREKTLYDFASTKKSTWSNLPTSFVPRNGIRMGDLSKEQRAKAMAVVAGVLSKEGYQKVVDIVDGDQKLADGAKGGKGGKGGKGPPAFGADEYYLAIFGQPSETKPWMVQFGGHHLGINVTVVGKHFILTPTHTGAQPALFKRDGKDVRPLGAENDAAFKLINALDQKQRAQAIIGERPQGELLLGPGRDDKKIDPKGIKGSALTAEQQTMLMDVVAAWINILEPDTAKARLKVIKEKVGETYFAWSGSTAMGSAAYFRVQGPTVVIEYAPQGGTDHIHTVIRNPEDDYGAGTLKQ
jgi:Protein of unknown function (DUF3500)